MLASNRNAAGASSQRAVLPGAASGLSSHASPIPPPRGDEGALMPDSLQQSIFREALLHREPLFDVQHEYSVIARLLSPDAVQQRRRYRWDRSPASSSTRQSRAADAVPKQSSTIQLGGTFSKDENAPDPEMTALEEPPMLSPIRWVPTAPELSQAEVEVPHEMEVSEFIQVFSPSANRAPPRANPSSGISNPSHPPSMGNGNAATEKWNRGEVGSQQNLPPRLNPTSIQQLSSPAVQSPSTITAEFGPATPSSLLMQAWSPTPSASTVDDSASRTGMREAAIGPTPLNRHPRRAAESSSSLLVSAPTSTIQREGIFTVSRSPATSWADRHAGAPAASTLPSLTLPTDHTLFAPRPRQVPVDRDEQNSVPAASVSLQQNPATSTVVKDERNPSATEDFDPDHKADYNRGPMDNHEPVSHRQRDTEGAYLSGTPAQQQPWSVTGTGMPRTSNADLLSKSIRSPIPNVSSRLRDTFMRHAPDRAYAVGRSLGVDMVYEAKHAARRKIQLERELDEIHAAEKQRRDQIRSDEAHERVQMQIFLRRRILQYQLHQVEQQEAIARHSLALESEHMGWLALLEDEEVSRAAAAANERNRVNRADLESEEHRRRQQIRSVRDTDLQSLLEAELREFWEVMLSDVEREEQLKREQWSSDEARLIEELRRLECLERGRAGEKESLRLRLEAIAEALRATEQAEQEDRELIVTMEWSARSGLELRAEELRHLHLKEVAAVQAMELMRRLQTQRADLESKELSERNAAIVVDFEVKMGQLLDEEILDRFRVQRLLVEQAEQVQRRDIVSSSETKAFQVLLETERREREVAFGLEQGRWQRYFEGLFSDLQKVEEQRRKELIAEANEQWDSLLSTETSDRRQLLLLAQSRALSDQMRLLEQRESEARTTLLASEDQIYSKLTQDSWTRLQLLSFFDSHRQTRFERVEEEIQERKKIYQIAETERLDALERQRKRKEEEARLAALKQLREKALRQGKPFVGFGLAEKVDASTFSTRSLRKPTDQPHIVVDSMYLDGPAHVEGLHLNDLVESVGGEKCLNLVQIRQVISEKAKVGQKLLIMVKRMVREAPRETTTSPTPQEGRSKSNAADSTSEMTFLVTQSDDDEVRSEGGTSLGALSAVSSTMGNMVEKSLTFCVSVRTAEKEFAPLEDLYFDTSAHEKIERGNSATRASLSRTSSGMRLATNSPSPAGSVASDGRPPPSPAGVGAPTGTHLLVPPGASFRRSSAPTAYSSLAGGATPGTPSKESSIRKPVVEVVSPGKSIPAKGSMHGKPLDKPKK